MQSFIFSGLITRSVSVLLLTVELFSSSITLGGFEENKLALQTAVGSIRDMRVFTNDKSPRSVLFPLLQLKNWLRNRRHSALNSDELESISHFVAAYRTQLNGLFLNKPHTLGPAGQSATDLSKNLKQFFSTFKIIQKDTDTEVWLTALDAVLSESTPAFKRKSLEVFPPELLGSILDLLPSREVLNNHLSRDLSKKRTQWWIKNIARVEFVPSDVERSVPQHYFSLLSITQIAKVGAIRSERNKTFPEDLWEVITDSERSQLLHLLSENQKTLGEASLPYRFIEQLKAVVIDQPVSSLQPLFIEYTQALAQRREEPFVREVVSLCLFYKEGLAQNVELAEGLLNTNLPLSTLQELLLKFNEKRAELVEASEPPECFLCRLKESGQVKLPKNFKHSHDPKFHGRSHPDGINYLHWNNQHWAAIQNVAETLIPAIYQEDENDYPPTSLFDLDINDDEYEKRRMDVLGPCSCRNGKKSFAFKN